MPILPCQKLVNIEGKLVSHQYAYPQRPTYTNIYYYYAYHTLDLFHLYLFCFLYISVLLSGILYVHKFLGCKLYIKIMLYSPTLEE